MEHAAIELKAISCRDLTIPLALFGSPPVYAVVSIGDGTGRAGSRRSQSTQFDRIGGRNPEWDQEMLFDLAGEGLFSLILEFDVIARRGVGGVLGDLVLGKVRVPLRDLVEEYAASRGGGGFRFVRYQVRSPAAKPAGDVTFLYRVRSRSQDVESPSPARVSLVTPSASYYPRPPSPPAAVEEPYAVQLPEAMYYSPAPDSYSYTAAGYCFPGSGYVEPWGPHHPAAPPPMTQPYGLPWNEYASSGAAWSAEGRTHRTPMYGPVNK